jgi:uncharacterized membrane protein YccC
MTASVVISSMSGGMLGVILAQLADFGLAVSVASYSGGGMIMTAAVVVYHMYGVTGRAAAQRA